MDVTILRVIAALLMVSVLGAAGAEPDVSALEARPSPEWVERGVIYQIQPRAFTPQGTLDAATGRLARVAELGVDIVYLCPVFVADEEADTDTWSPRQKASKMNNPRNPYRMKDYYHVDPEYGTDNDLKGFIAQVHTLGMRVLLDMVYLHCGPNAVFLDEHPNFVKRDAEGEIITADWGFPAINFDNAQLREYLLNNMEYWVEDFGADGFRCDVSDGVPLDFWATARERLAVIKPDICMLAEGRRREDQVKAFDLNYDFSWFATIRDVYEKGAAASSIREMAQKKAGERPRGARLMRYIDNHDIANDYYTNRLEKKWGPQRVETALLATFTIDGVPMLYNGQEAADAARHSIFGRAPIDWANADTPEGEARFEFCKGLCGMRHAERALTDGQVVWLENDRPEAVLSFLRRTSDEQILSVLNFTDSSIDVCITFPESREGAWSTLVGNGAKMDGDGSTCMLTLESFGYLVAKYK